MRSSLRWLKKNAILILDVVKLALIILLLVAFIDFNSNQQKIVTRVNNHIDCIVSLFGQPNRAQLHITDIHSCSLKPSGQ